MYRSPLLGAIALFATLDTSARADEPIPIGIVSSFFQDAPQQRPGALLEPFKALVRAQTGLSSEVHFSEGPALAQELADGKIKLAVFQGIEFAWARQRFPELQPLLLIVNQHPHQQARLLVRSDSSANGFADLRGKQMGLARSTRMHQRLFLERSCKACGHCEPPNFFGKLTRPATAEDGLDDLVDGVHDAMIVDAATWEGYQRRKPARSQRLKVLQDSEFFPATTVAHKPGQLNKEKLVQFQDGLIQANKGLVGKQLLSLWHLSGFETVPPDYDKIYADILTVYPPPEKTAASPQPSLRAPATTR